MIPILIKLIREHPHWLRNSRGGLSFMKTSTPASGTRADQGKVLLFVFEAGERWPTLCVKTVRTYAAGDAIRRNHDNLKRLRKSVNGTEIALMFAESLYLYDDGSTIFCVESACPGSRFSISSRNLELVMERHIAWQSHLARGAAEFQVLENNMKLPKITQHGDMTPDNVLVSGTDVYLIDYDYTGVCTLAGFDLFNFLSKMRLSPENLRLNYERYFPRYFESIGAEVDSYQSMLGHYHKAEVERKAEKI